MIASGIQLKESRIPLTIGIQNPSSTDRDIQYLETWIPLHQAILTGLPQHCTATRSSQKKITPSSILSEGRWRLCPWPLPDIKGTNHSVPIMLVSLLCGDPYYAGIPIMRVSLLCWCPYYAGVPIMRVCLLCGGPYYAGSLLYGCPYYVGSLLCRCPCYAGVPIKCGALKKTKTSRTHVLSIWSRKQTFSIETFVQILALILNFNSNKFILKKPNDLLS